MVIADNETGSLWQQATGECLAGPLKGKQLELIGGEMMGWGAWKSEHPNTTLAEEPAVWKGLLPKQKITEMLESVTSRMVPRGARGLDGRLPAHEIICGLVIAGESRAYPLSVLQKQRVVRDVLGGQSITIESSASGDRVSAYLGNPRQDIAKSDRLRVDRQFWLGWSEFHPGTGVYAVTTDKA